MGDRPPRATPIACRSLPGRRPPGHGPRRPPRRGGRADTPAPRGRGCPCDTRHGIGGCRGSVPQPGVGVHQRWNVVTRRYGARRAAHRRQLVQREPDQRGWDGRHSPPAAERQRSLARARVSARMGCREGRRSGSTSSFTRPSVLRLSPRSSTPMTLPSSSPGRCRNAFAISVPAPASPCPRSRAQSSGAFSKALR